MNRRVVAFPKSKLQQRCFVSLLLWFQALFHDDVVTVPMCYPGRNGVPCDEDLSRVGSRIAMEREAQRVMI